MAVQMTEEMNIRLTLAVQLKDKSIQEIKDIAEWVIGSKPAILPVSNFSVVKQ